MSSSPKRRTSHTCYRYVTHQITVTDWQVKVVFYVFVTKETHLTHLLQVRHTPNHSDRLTGKGRLLCLRHQRDTPHTPVTGTSHTESQWQTDRYISSSMSSSPKRRTSHTCHRYVTHWITVTDWQIHFVFYVFVTKEMHLTHLLQVHHTLNNSVRPMR